MHLIVFLLTLIRMLLCVNAALPVPPPRTWQAPDCGWAHADERGGRTRDHLPGLPRVRLPRVVSSAKFFLLDLHPHFKRVVEYQCWVRIRVSKVLKVTSLLHICVELRLFKRYGIVKCYSSKTLTSGLQQLFAVLWDHDDWWSLF